jgi:hypothetical protein
MLQNISPAVSELGDLGGLRSLAQCYRIFRQQYQFWGTLSLAPPEYSPTGIPERGMGGLRRLCGIASMSKYELRQQHQF